MQSVVGRESEPITPYIDRLRELYENYGISSIIVAGSSGSYFHKADHIIQMRQYIPEEITNFAKVKAAEYPLKMDKAPSCREPSFDRRPKGVRERPGERTKIKVLGKDSIQLNRDNIDLRYVEQLVDSEQLTALGYLLNYAQKHLMDGQRSMVQIVDELTDILNKNGLDKICESSYLPSGLAMPRKQEIFACFNRYRKLNV